MGEVEIVELIRTRLTVRGEGTPDSVMRLIEQYWTKDGVLLFEFDPCPTGRAPVEPRPAGAIGIEVTRTMR